MKPAKFDYVAPESLDEAIALLAANPDDAQIIAGGQSLTPMLNFRMAGAALLIDINRIVGLSGIRLGDDGAVHIGATTRHRDVELSPLVARHLPLVHAAMPYVAHVAVRNRGTIGGSLCLAEPSAEWPALCIACEAEIVLASPRGRRRVTAEEFPLAPYTTSREEDEILEEVIFPAWPANRRFGFEEVSRRAGDFAIIGIASVLDLGTDRRINAARIVAFGLGDRALLLDAPSAALLGRVPEEAAVAAAIACADEGLEFDSDFHASAAYRRRLVQRLVGRTLRAALGIKTEQDG
ncbi:MAG: xanthine dehydrogenase family protein subunit M [Microbacterium sp.]